MAKKGTAVQLQTDVFTDEDWDKLLDKSGLIVVDVYSEWCGQCSAMSAILKKLKLEIGGDLMNIAAAKCDNIKDLERFRDKSEPTWMFISDRKVVNLMFGANAPKLIATITSELRKEKESRDGVIRRTTKNVYEPCGEEQERYEKKEAIDRATREAEQAATKKEIRIRREKEADALLQQFNEVSILLAWPHAMAKALEIMQEQFEKYGLCVGLREKPIITPEDIELIEYFADGFKFPEESKEAIINIKAMAWLVKGGEDPSNIDEVLKAAVYGPSKAPPGDPGYPAYILRRGTSQEEIEHLENKPKGKEGDSELIYGLWCPPNGQTKAMAMKTLFKHLAHPHLPPEPETIPLHIAMAFDAFKRKEVMALIKDYPKEVMRFGFFTEENAETAKLIAKTITNFEKNVSASHTEKLIIQLSKKRSDPLLAFAQLGPSYMSTNSVEGERECKLFFPKDYDIPEEEEVVEEDVKKSKKKKKSVATVGTADSGGAKDDTELTMVQLDENGEEIIEDDEEGDEDEEGVEQDDDENGDNNAETGEDDEVDVVDEEEHQSKEKDTDIPKDDGDNVTDAEKATNTAEIAVEEVPPTDLENENVSST